MSSTSLPVAQSSVSHVFSCRYCFSEMAPVCAVVGGILAQEIVKVKSPCGKKKRKEKSPCGIDHWPSTPGPWTCRQRTQSCLRELPGFSGHTHPCLLTSLFPFFLPFSTSSPSLQSIHVGLQQMTLECLLCADKPRTGHRAHGVLSAVPYYTDQLLVL